jgi:GcrA cell cycle regulator
MQAGGDWTDARKELATELWKAGKSASQIARALGGITRNAVIGKLHRMGLKRETPGVARFVTKTPPRAPKAPKVKPITRAQATREGLAAHNLRRRLAETPVPIPPLREVVTATARPWITRGAGECSWPVWGEGADTWSCCAPAHKAGWCRGHFAIGTVPAKRTATDMARHIERQIRRKAA